MSNFLYLLEKLDLETQRALLGKDRISDELVLICRTTLYEILVCCADLENRVRQIELDRSPVSVKPQTPEEVNEGLANALKQIEQGDNM